MNNHTTLLISLLVASSMAGTLRAAAPAFTAFPLSAQSIVLLRDSAPYLTLTFDSWGPAWSWLGLRGTVAERDGAAHMALIGTVAATHAHITLDALVSRTNANALRVQTVLGASRDTALTLVCASLLFDPDAFKGGVACVTHRSGTNTFVTLPLEMKGLGSDVTAFTVRDAAGQELTFTLTPACAVGSDNAARIVLAQGRCNAGAPARVAWTITLPGPLTFYPTPAHVPVDPAFRTWFPFQPTSDPAKPNEIGMQDWLDKPAGAHGRILRRGEFLLYDNAPIKLWGINVTYAGCAPNQQLADKRAAFYPKYGINAVRLHKYADGFGWAGIQAKDSFLAFDPAALDRMDYFVAALKKQGIYVLLSSTFGVKLGPADATRVPYIDEFLGGAGKRTHQRPNRVETGHGSVYLARELQDLQIEQIVRMLTHTNRYTGRTYADDPAVAVVELFNEDSALFFGTMPILQNVPTLRARAAAAFTAWLQKRYGSKDTWLKAWGPAALNCFAGEGFTNESWEAKTIVPAGNPWFFDPDQLAGDMKPRRVRLLDTMLFLYELQNEFYQRYVAAIRKTGYTGEILGSNWQAGRAYSHYYNLYSDYLVGLIDRHNYFGGGGGGQIDNATMLAVPGSGMLSSGMQQVADRPFMLSEWLHVSPNEWRVEGPAILGAYGLGLQGWDASFIFQNGDDGALLGQVNQDKFEVMAPQVLGAFPTIARQVLRGDVTESPVLAPRNVCVPALHDGLLDFTDRVLQEWDVKTFDSDKVPSRALAVARCVINFTNAPVATPAFDLAAYASNGVYASTTQQLRWHAGTAKLAGFFTINTPATKAVVGFANGQRCDLGDVTITPQSRYAAIYVTARERDRDLAGTTNVLIVAMARARNTGTSVYQDRYLLSPGSAPILMEPVTATIQFAKPGRATVHLLDHDGARTDKTLPVVNGAFTIDGARDKTCYYLVTYAP